LVKDSDFQISAKSTALKPRLVQPRPAAHTRQTGNHHTWFGIAAGNESFAVFTATKKISIAFIVRKIVQQFTVAIDQQGPKHSAGPVCSPRRNYVRSTMYFGIF